MFLLNVWKNYEKWFTQPLENVLSALDMLGRSSLSYF